MIPNIRAYFIVIIFFVTLLPFSFADATRTTVWTSKEAWNNNPQKDSGGLKSVTYIEIDGDSLLDLYANAGTCSVYAYKNTGTLSQSAWTAYSDWNVGCSVIATIHGQSSFGDLDGDGLKDAMYGGYDTFGVRFFKNTGTANAPAFTRDATYDISIGATNYTRSDIVDLDNDGLLDVVVTDNSKTPFVFQNTGTASVPVFTRKAEWEPVLSDSGSSAPTMSFADLDDDGDFDFIVGYHYQGGAYAYENTGSASVPSWARKASWDPPLVQGSTSVDRVAGLTLGDIDGDGDSDLMIAGRVGSNSYAFENTGSEIVVEAVQNTTATYSSSGGTTMPRRIANLIEMGAYEMARQLILEYPHTLNNYPVPIPESVSSFIQSMNRSVSKEKYFFSNNLWSGMRNEDVKRLQEFLNNHGYRVANIRLGSKGDESTYFGKLTIDALKKFQKDNNLPVDGVFWSNTRAIVNYIVASE